MFQNAILRFEVKIDWDLGEGSSAADTYMRCGIIGRIWSLMWMDRLKFGWVSSDMPSNMMKTWGREYV